MDIKIYEVVCCKGSKLENILVRALKELDLCEHYEIISDFQSVLNKGILSPPALLINDKVYLSGRLPSVEQVKEAIKNVRQEY